MSVDYSTVVESAAGAALAPRSWLDYEHAEYCAKKAKWQLVRDFYTGDVLEDEKVKCYLVQRSQGEPLINFTERVRIADYTNHFGMIVDGLAGVLFMTEPNTTRLWNQPANPNQNIQAKKGLGSENDPNSPASRLLKDADGEGHGWLTLWKDLALELTAYHKAWVLVDVVAGVPVCRIINVLDVPNWVDSKSGPTSVVVKEQQDVRVSIEDDPSLETRFLRFDLTGWTRWKQGKQGEAIQLTGPGDSGSYRYVDLKGNPTLPIFPVDTTMRRLVGWSLAMKAKAIFNLESSIDWILWAANFPKLNVMGGEETFSAVEASLKKGDNILQNEKGEVPHNYITPPTTSATVANEVAKRKTQDLFISGFREYGDSARDRVTATEVRQDVAAGAGAFLTLLKAALEGAEQRAGFLIEQAEFKDRPFMDLGGFTVERSEDFMPFDIQNVIEQAQKRYFGNEPIPAGRDAKRAMAEQILKWEGLPINSDQILSDIDTTFAETVLQYMDTLDMPADAKAELVLRICDALGLFKSQSLNRDTVRQEIVKLATAREDMTLRLGETGRVNTQSGGGVNNGASLP